MDPNDGAIFQNDDVQITLQQHSESIKSLTMKVNGLISTISNSDLKRSKEISKSEETSKYNGDGISNIIETLNQIEETVNNSKNIPSKLDEIEVKIDSIMSTLEDLKNLHLKSGNRDKMEEEYRESYDPKNDIESCSDSNVIFSIRIGGAINCFPQFEEQLEEEINKKIETKNQSWNLFKKKMPNYTVKKISGLDEIGQNPPIVLLCAYTESIRLDSSEIVPFIDLIKNSKNPKYMLYVIFRFGDSAQEATIPDPNDEQKSLVSRELVYNFHFYAQNGLIQTSSTIMSCNNLFQLLRDIRSD